MSDINIIIVSHSALEFWLNSSVSLSSAYSLKNCPRVPLPSGSILRINDSIAESIAKALELPLPLEIISPDSAKRAHFASYILRRRPKNLSGRALIQIDEADLPRSFSVGPMFIRVFVASPEYCFVSQCRYLSIANAALLGTDLCAAYMPKNDGTGLFHKRQPVTASNEIMKFLNNNPTIYGSVTALKAVNYISDNSFSPMESRLAVILVLPLHSGGYALPKPELNKFVRLCSTGAAILKRDSCCCDMVWEEPKLICEYDSNLTHLEANQHAYDKARYNALTASGYKVISITANNVKDFDSIEAMAKLIRRSLHMHSQSDRLAKYRNQRYETVKELFYKNRLI